MKYIDVLTFDGYWRVRGIFFFIKAQKGDENETQNDKFIRRTMTNRQHYISVTDQETNMAGY